MSHIRTATVHSHPARTVPPVALVLIAGLIVACGDDSGPADVTPEPAVPSGLTADAVSISQIDLAWSHGGEHVTQFRIERRAEGEDSWQQIATAGAEARGRSDVGLEAETGYRYRIRACNGDVCSSFSGEASAETWPETPPVPSGLEATAVSETAVEVTWDGPGDATVDSFELERREGDGEWGAAATTQDTSHLDEGLEPGTTYGYRLRSCNVTGCSGQSAPVDVTTPESVPTAPTGLSAEAISSSEIDLQWGHDGAFVAGFRIERRGAGEDWSQIATADADASTYGDTGLAPATAYEYRMRACNGDGACSDYSSTVSAETDTDEPDDPGEVTISSVAPDPLAAGGSFTITGTGFPSAPDVTVAGIAAEVTASSSTEIQGTVPASMSCLPTAPVEVTVQSVSVDHPLRTGREVTLAPGDAAVIGRAEDDACLELPESDAEYLVTVFNATDAPGSQIDFRVRGQGGGSSSGTAARTSMPTAGVSRTAPFDAAAATPGRHSHTWILEESRRLVDRMGPPPRMAGFGAVAPAGLPDEGDIVTLNFPDFDGNGGACEAPPVEIDARVVRVGTHGIVYEDVDNPLAGEMDDALASMGEEFDAVQFDILEEYFGDPFAFRDNLSGPRRITMIFSKEVNERSPGTAGFVYGGDFFPPGDGSGECTASNHRETFYAYVPMQEDDLSSWNRSMPGTVIHEVKHVTSFAETFANGVPMEEVWLEEATARMSEELWGRSVYGYEFAGRTTYEESIYCEVRPGWSGCGSGLLAVLGHFHGFSLYLDQVEGLTPLGPVGSGDDTFYGSGWSLIRWMIDHASTSEAAFLTALTGAGQTGVDNLSAHSGLELRGMLAGWTLATYADGRGIEPSDPEHAFRSWDTRDIYRGLHDDFPSVFPGEHPLEPRTISAGGFDVAVSGLRGGTAAYFEVATPADGAQSLEIAAGDGSLPHGALGVVVLRVR